MDFYQSFCLGNVHYARDSKRWLKDKKVEDLVKEIEILKKKKKDGN